MHRKLTGVRKCFAEFLNATEMTKLRAIDTSAQLKQVQVDTASLVWLQKNDECRRPRRIQEAAQLSKPLMQTVGRAIFKEVTTEHRVKEFRWHEFFEIACDPFIVGREFKVSFRSMNDCGQVKACYLATLPRRKIATECRWTGSNIQDTPR